MPTISICIPVYNRRAFVSRAVQSALAQEQVDLEVVVVDNCSDDGTWEILQSISDPRVRVFRNSHNVGMVDNFTRCCEHGEGEFLLMLCSDDILCPGFLKHATDLMRANPGAALLSSVGRFVTPDGKVLSLIANKIEPGIYEGVSATPAFFEFAGRYQASIFNYPAGIVMRKSAFLQSKPFRREVGNPADADMWLRCLAHGDLLVTDFVACEITRHTNQEGAAGFRAGRYFTELLHMSELHLRESEDAPIRIRFRKLLGGIAMTWVLKSLKVGNQYAWREAKAFGWSVCELFAGLMRHWAFRLSAKAGIVSVPGLKRLGAASFSRSRMSSY